MNSQTEAERRLAQAIRARLAANPRAFVPPPPSLPPTVSAPSGAASSTRTAPSSSSGSRVVSTSSSASSASPPTSSSSSSTSSRPTTNSSHPTTRSGKDEAQQEAPTSTSTSSSTSSSQDTSSSPLSSEIAAIVDSILSARLRTPKESSQPLSSTSTRPSEPPTSLSPSSAPDIAAALSVLRASDIAHLLDDRSASLLQPVLSGSRTSSHPPAGVPSVAAAAVADDSDSDADGAAAAQSRRPQSMATRRRTATEVLIASSLTSGVFAPSGSPSTDLAKNLEGHFVGINALKAALFASHSSRSNDTRIFSYGDLANVSLTAAVQRAQQLLVSHGADAVASYLIETGKLVSRLMSFERRLPVEEVIHVRDSIMIESTQDGKPFSSVNAAEKFLSAQMASSEPSRDAGSSPQPIISTFCGAYNSFRGCLNEACPKPHRCRSCRRHGHGKPDCPRHPGLQKIKATRDAQPALGLPFFYQQAPPPQPQPSQHVAPLHSAPHPLPNPPTFSYLPPVPGAITAYPPPFHPPPTSQHPPAPKRPKRL